MRIQDIQPDDVLMVLHDKGAAMGLDPLFYRVLKVAKVKVKVRCETGAEGWMHPATFDKKMKPTEVDYVEWR